MTQMRDPLGALVKEVLTGLETSVPKGLKVLMVGNEELSISQLAKVLKEHDDLWRIPEELGAAFHAAVENRESKVPTVRDFMTDVKYALVAAMGSKNPELLKFGIEPKRARRKLTSQERVEAAAKARATRKERHTMGRRQKEALAEGEKKPTA